MTTQQMNQVSLPDPEKAALNKRLETTFWGLFLILLGGWALLPAAMVPKNAWTIGVGFLLLGLNAARYFLGIRMSGFTTLLGVLLLLGVVCADWLGWKDVNGAFLLVILGLYLVFKPWFEKHKLFGKAEEG